MKQQKDPGLGSKFSGKVSRMINQDGSYNIIRKGSVTGLRDVYTYLLEINWLSFFGILLSVYTVLNLIFASIYTVIGVDQLSGMGYELPKFWHAFFFSIQTFTTVGYGGLAPSGWGANIVSSIEAFSGLLSFSVATGLLYGRFSKPSSKIRYSNNVILTPFEGKKAMMFKMVNQRKNILLNTKVKVLLSIDSENIQRQFEKQYYSVNLETDFVSFFPLTWTLVHKIDNQSPLLDISLRDLKKRNAELIILTESFDETFGKNIISKHSYAGEQWLENVKFVKNFSSNEKGQIVLDVDGIDEVERAN